MKTEILKTEEGFKKLWNDWNELLGRSGLNVIFLTHEWLSAWWEDFGTGHSLFIIIVKEGGELKAIAPFMITAKKKLQFIGHDLSDYLDLIVADNAEECFKLIFGELARNQRLWVWADFVYIMETSPLFKHWQLNLRSLKRAKGSMRQDCSSVILDLNKCKGWVELEKKLPSKRRNDLKRCPRLLREKGELSFRRISNYDEIKNCFDHFVVNHKRRWRAEGMGSQFDDSLQIEHYLNIARKLSPRRWVEIAALKLGDEYIALAFGYLYNGRYYYYTPTFNPDYWKYSPGNILIKHLIESFYADGGIKIFDLLRGNEPYKYIWSKQEIPLYRAQIYPYKLSSLLIYCQNRLLTAMIPKLKRVPYLKNLKQLLMRARRNIKKCIKH